ncbi:hypothetical protein C8R47DRAFT_1201007 [Mycena vitilis]|nr:hypothetical protein C8R47DRAFT_1201007 [Mycena vitilis]
MAEAIARVAYEIRVHDSLHILGISFMYYDYFLTLDDEISFLWKRSGWSTYLFFAVRYTALLGNIPVLALTFMDLPEKWCTGYHIGHQTVLVGAQLIVSVVMLLRVFALYARSYRVLFLVLLFSIPLLGVVFWATQDQQATPIIGFSGCHISIAQSTAFRLAGSWEALFAFDTLVFVLILGKTYSTWKRNAGYMTMGIQTVILKDGALYFAAIAFSNLCNILSFYLGGPILAGGLATFASCMSVTLMSRLMLNLHRKAADGVLHPNNPSLHPSFHAASQGQRQQLESGVVFDPVYPPNASHAADDRFTPAPRSVPRRMRTAERERIRMGAAPIPLALNANAPRRVGDVEAGTDGGTDPETGMWKAPSGWY